MDSNYLASRVNFLEGRLNTAITILKKIDEEIGGAPFNSTHRTIKEYFDLDNVIRNLERHSKDE